MPKVRRVYFDNASTTEPDPEVLKTYEKLLETAYVNSESLYEEGLQVHKMVEKSRQAIASLLGVKPDEVIFTSGAAEANTTAIKGIPFAMAGKKHIVTSCVEHSSILNACRQMQDVFGYDVTYLPVYEDGKVHFNDVKEAVREDTALVSVMYVNNETGAVNPVNEIGTFIRHETHAVFHVDMTQAVGKVPLDFTDIDAASLSAHKFNGIKGSGLFIKKKYVPLVPLINGGEQEYGLRGGTINAPADIVMAKTLRLALEKGRKYHEQLAELKNYLVDQLKTIDGIEINSPADGIVSTVNFSYENIMSEVMQNALNEKGFMVSARSTCDSRSGNPSYVLRAMGFSEKRANSCIRISLSDRNTKEEIDAFIQALKEIIASYSLTFTF
jgi:cysteine desulfurase